jgi:hypothetical protein
MPTSDRTTPSAEELRRESDRLRAAGLRPVEIWVPNTRAPHFLAEARRQSLLVSRQPSEQEILDFIEAAADLEGWA